MDGLGKLWMSMGTPVEKCYKLLNYAAGQMHELMVWINYLISMDYTRRANELMDMYESILTGLPTDAEE